MRPRPAPVLALVLGLTLLGSCSSGNDDDQADSTLPSSSAPTTATTTTPADPFAIPEAIDEAYVNKVLAALDQIHGDAVREIVSRGTLSFESIERIRSIYNDPEYEQQEIGLRDLLDETTAARFKTPPGNRKSAVTRQVSATAQCIYVKVRVDFSDVVVSPSPVPADEFQAVILERTQSGADPKRLNPTPWSIRHDEVLRGAQQPKEARCGG